jgi:hypothetical protein
MFARKRGRIKADGTLLVQMKNGRNGAHNKKPATANRAGLLYCTTRIQ